ncbi:transposase [Rhodocaloribacter sp.]
MSDFARVGDFCPYEDCPDFGKTGLGNLIRFGKTRQGKQRFRCKTCRKTFNENYGTLLHGKRTEEKDILETLALLAEGVRISSLHRTKGFKEDTILRWLREAAEHAEELEERLLEDYQIERGQLDGLWSYVRNKGQKNTTKRPSIRASSGVQR